MCKTSVSDLSEASVLLTVLGFLYIHFVLCSTLLISFLNLLMLPMGGPTRENEKKVRRAQKAKPDPRMDL